MKRLIIDRFEGKYAVCEMEDRKMVNILKADLPDSAVEGSLIIIDEDGSYTLDLEEHKRRKDEITKLMENLFE